jgi:DNA gyrase subunit A
MFNKKNMKNKKNKTTGNHYIIFAAEDGKVAKMDIDNFRESSLCVGPGHKTFWLGASSGTSLVQLITANGMAITFRETDIRPGGSYVVGIRLSKGDKVVKLGVFEEDKKNIQDYQMLIVTEKGFGKRVDFNEGDIRGRGGVGSPIIKLNKKTGKIAKFYLISVINSDADVFLVSEKGQTIKVPLEAFSVLSKNSFGVRLIKFKNENDKIVDAS